MSKSRRLAIFESIAPSPSPSSSPSLSSSFSSEEEDKRRRVKRESISSEEEEEEEEKGSTTTEEEEEEGEGEMEEGEVLSFDDFCCVYEKQLKTLYQNFRSQFARILLNIPKQETVNFFDEFMEDVYEYYCLQTRDEE